MQLEGKTVAVTGATGFIGRYIMRALLDRGAHAVAVVRTPSKAKEFADRGAEIRKADLADIDALTRGFEGADAVISNAATVHLAGTSRDELIRQNVGGTENVFEAMRRAGITRCIQTSSAAAYRPKRGHFYVEGDALRSPNDPPAPLSAYGVSKAAAEDSAWRLADEYGIALSTVRPHSVHGAFDQGTFTLWFKRLLAPPITVFPTSIRIPSVYAGDIAEAMCLMLEKPVSEGRAYNICGAPGEVTMWEMAQAYREAGGASPLAMLPFPFPFVRRFSIERAEQDLGFRNRPVVDGFREMVALERAGQ